MRKCAQQNHLTKSMFWEQTRLSTLEQQVRDLTRGVQSLTDEVRALHQMNAFRYPPPPPPLQPVRLIDKDQSTLIANLPPPRTTNPIAALLNYGQHYLGMTVEFAHHQDPDTHLHVITVSVHNQILARVSDSRKRVAREQAAREALFFLNQNPEILLDLDATRTVPLDRFNQ